MTNGSTTLAGIEIPSTDPIFLTVVAGIHIPLGMVCVVVGALAMLSKKQRDRHSIFRQGLLLVPASALRVGDVPVDYALHLRSMIRRGF